MKAKRNMTIEELMKEREKKLASSRYFKSNLVGSTSIEKDGLLGDQPDPNQMYNSIALNHDLYDWLNNEGLATANNTTTLSTAPSFLNTNPVITQTRTSKYRQLKITSGGNGGGSKSNRNDSKNMGSKKRYSTLSHK